MNRTVAPVLLLVAALLLALVACQAPAAAPAASSPDGQLRAAVAAAGVGPLPAAARPHLALFALGQALFFDRELSGNRDLACATCHHPNLASTDGLPLSVGVGGRGLGPARQLGPDRHFIARNATDLFNRGLPDWETMFWDGRVTGGPTSGYTTPAGDHLPAGLQSLLAAQALFPVTFRDEMRGGRYSVAGYAIAPGAPVSGDQTAASGWYDTDVFGRPNELALINNTPADFHLVWDGVLARLLALSGYQALFQAAYPGLVSEQFTFSHVTNALAAFQTQAFTSAGSPWDRYLAGDDTALSDEARQGALLFLGRAGCAGCHSGPFLSDQQYHNIAVPQFGPGMGADVPLDTGRGAVTGNPADRFAFRTPPLRNVALTGPWLHNGAYNSLEAAVRHHLRPAAALRAYDASQLSPELRSSLQDHPVTIAAILETLDPRLTRPASLSDREIAQLLAFLNALTDPAALDLSALVPATVPSGLPVER